MKYKQYRKFDDDIISIGFALMGLTAVDICLVIFIIVELM